MAKNGQRMAGRVVNGHHWSTQIVKTVKNDLSNISNMKQSSELNGQCTHINANPRLYRRVQEYKTPQHPNLRRVFVGVGGCLKLRSEGVANQGLCGPPPASGVHVDCKIRRSGYAAVTARGGWGESSFWGTDTPPRPTDHVAWGV